MPLRGVNEVSVPWQRPVRRYFYLQRQSDLHPHRRAENQVVTSTRVTQNSGHGLWFAACFPKNVRSSRKWLTNC
jgi:hypothetical protein